MKKIIIAAFVMLSLSGCATPSTDGTTASPPTASSPTPDVSKGDPNKPPYFTLVNEGKAIAVIDADGIVTMDWPAIQATAAKRPDDRLDVTPQDQSIIHGIAAIIVAVQAHASELKP